ncbi:MAG: monovalent cation/H(+) antiporter subunit G [Spirochaetales bacterium]|nr:monovalent cation/H(+) antiporter subunit G [Spirochaetales bacterium]
MEIAGSIFVLIGSLIFFLSSLGVIRMPDVYNRIQTGTKATTLGTIFVLVGLAFLSPDWTAKLAVLLVFILLTNPVSSHVVARAAHFNKEPMSPLTIEDKLEAKEEEA